MMYFKSALTKVGVIEMFVNVKKNYVKYFQNQAIFFFFFKF
jgi:hypothetical protein